MGVALSPRDAAVLKGLAAGFTIQHIAESECIAERPIARRIDGLKEQFGADTLFALAYEATRRGHIA